MNNKNNQDHHESDVNRGNQLNPNNNEYHSVRNVSHSDVNRANQMNPNNNAYRSSRGKK